MTGYKKLNSNLYLNRTLPVLMFFFRTQALIWMDIYSFGTVQVTSDIIPVRIGLFQSVIGNATISSTREGSRVSQAHFLN